MTPTPDQLRAALAYDPLTGEFRWREGRKFPGQVAGTRAHIYVQIELDGIQCYGHQLAWLWMTGQWPSGEVDHRNGDKQDNRWANLRDVSKEINMQNSVDPYATNTHGHRGVYLDKRRGHWVARIMAAGQLHWLGSFATAEEAEAAHFKAKTDLHPFTERLRAERTTT